MKNLMITLTKTQLLIGSLISTVLYFGTSYVLEGLYAKSKFSVPYFEAQTSFDAIKLKMWFQELIDFGTMNIYYQTQYFDFVFILTVITTGFFIWNLVGSLFSKNSWFYKKRYALSIFLPLAGTFDIFENFVSFFMLSKPTSFNHNLVYLYSGFASLKFLCWGVALIILVILLLALPIEKLGKKRMSKIA